ncbi:MAG: dTDP-4-dehydrorhamnose 3,5-epimerase [Desulfobacteraceae bacterium]|nr:dTDP-4-dehydrorhamnose 3,5-epimerase [Desulfobacteraceae bacterium]
MKYTRFDIPGVVLMEPVVFGDERGFFMETWRDDEFRKEVADISFIQDNHSLSVKGTLRGLHYQIQNPQGKLIRVISGEVFDVVVDLRRSSTSFGKWTGVKLSGKNKQILWVPPGFAHGFYVLSDVAEFGYRCTDYYTPEYERAILWDDHDIGIDWPLVSGGLPLLSSKDRQGVAFKDAEVFK